MMGLTLKANQNKLDKTKPHFQINENGCCSFVLKSFKTLLNIILGSSLHSPYHGQFECNLVDHLHRFYFVSNEYKHLPRWFQLQLYSPILYLIIVYEVIPR